jgi:AraC-like DNA-binding protein
MDTISTILSLGAAQGIILSIIILTIRRGDRLANRILASILIVFSISIFLHTLSQTNSKLNLPSHEGIISILFYLIGPLIYFYVKALTIPNFVITKKDYLHLMPFFICLVIHVPFYLQPSMNKIQHTIGEIVAVGAVFQTFAYIILAITELRKHKRAIKESFSSLEKINLNWLRFLIIGYIITWTIAIVLEGFHGKIESWDYSWIIVSVFMYAIGYMGLRQPEIFSGIQRENVKKVMSPKRKYEKSTLSPEMAQEYLEKLQNHMFQKKPYLNNNITLPTLANQLAISTHHLSQIINENFNQNFFEFINSYRVEELKQLIRNPKNQNINLASLGLDAGFNSISAFNAAFKKHTGITPSEFRESKQNT